MQATTRKRPIEAATHYDVLFAVQKMLEACGNADIVKNVLDCYFNCMLKGYEPFYSVGESRGIAMTFFNLCKLFYVQNYTSTNPQTEFYIPQKLWVDNSDGLSDEYLKILKEFGCIDYEERENLLIPSNTDMPSKICVYKISNRALCLIMRFAKNIYDTENFKINN